MRMLWAHGLVYHQDPRLCGYSPVWRIVLQSATEMGVWTHLFCSSHGSTQCVGGVVSIETSIKIVPSMARWLTIYQSIKGGKIEVVMESTGFFDSGLQLICIFLVSCFSFSSWQYTMDYLWVSGLVSLLASQAHQLYWWSFICHLTNFWCVWQCGQVPNPAENEISIFKTAGQQKEAWITPKFLGKWVQWRFFKNTMYQLQQMTLYPKSSKTGNLTLDFNQLGLWASPPFLQTLGPWFPNEIQNLLSSEKRTLDHWGKQSSSSSP